MKRRFRLPYRINEQTLEELKNDLDQLDNCVPVIRSSHESGLMGSKSAKINHIISVIRDTNGKWFTVQSLRKRLPQVHPRTLRSIIQDLKSEGLLDHMNAKRPALYLWTGKFSKAQQVILDKKRAHLEVLIQRVEHYLRRGSIGYADYSMRFGRNPTSLHNHFIRFFNEWGSTIFTADQLLSWLEKEGIVCKRNTVWSYLSRLAQGGILIVTTEKRVRPTQYKLTKNVWTSTS